MKNLNAKGIKHKVYPSVSVKNATAGITLIALVITIIVLLILAAVSIATLTGENGILTKASDAKTKTGQTNGKEQVQIAVLGSYDTNGNLDYDALRDNLNKISGITGVPDTITDSSFLLTVTVDGYEVTINSDGTVTLAGTGETGDTSGANHPELKDGMTAITFDESGNPQTVADATTKTWYSYEVTTDDTPADGGTTEDGNSKWANATLNGNYYVWIPRYAYKIDTSVTYTSQSGTSKKIDVKFIGTDVTQENIATKLGDSYADYIVHPAFTFGTQELSGFWVGKYETTGTADAPTILPNETSLRSINVSTMFSTARLLRTTNYDAHMMKNIEWGAVAYLAQSPYGRNGTEISVNQCSGYITGAGKTTGDNKIYESSTYSTPTEEQQYNGSIGKLASTTGNIYGVYDMSGGAFEYVMGFYGTAENTPTLSSTGFTTAPDKKYYDLYTSTTHIGGDALYETKGWNSGFAGFVGSDNPVFFRGGSYDFTVNPGAFVYGGNNGNSDTLFSFRVCLAVK